MKNFSINGDIVNVHVLFTVKKTTAALLNRYSWFNLFTLFQVAQNIFVD